MALVYLSTLQKYFYHPCQMEKNQTSNAVLTLNAPIATKVVCFSIRLLLLEQSVLGSRCLLLHLIRQ